MKKKFLITLLVLIVALTCALSLSACGLVDFWKGVINGTINGEGGKDEPNFETNYDNNVDSESGLFFTLNSDGNSYSATVSTAEKKEVVIPSEFKGLPVTSIGKDLFQYNAALTSVTIHDSVTYIGESAFERCASLKSITIPSGVTYIGAQTFRYCSSLTSVTIPDGVTYIGFAAFADCTSITKITVPDSVTDINSYAFGNCPIETATIPAIACECIVNSKIKTVIVTSGESIGSAFEYCESLTSITLPSGIKSIDSSAFEYCTSLTSVNIPDGVTSIGELAFYHCSSLKSLTIPGSVTKIDRAALAFCENLTNITFKGTVREWNAITKDNNWNNYSYFTISCTDGKIERSGNVTWY